MQTSFIKEKIRENAKTKVVFKSDIGGRPHVVRGELFRESEDFFYVENFSGDVIPVPKNSIVSMIFLKDKRQKESAVKPDPVTPKTKRSSEKFSYSL